MFGIIALGIASRLIHTGWLVFDKYAGDALYAAMAYVILGLVKRRPVKTKAITSMIGMTALECFQLTEIPTQLYLSGNVLLKGIAILLGLQFAWSDLMAYGVGIICIAATDVLLEHKQDSVS